MHSGQSGRPASKTDDETRFAVRLFRQGRPRHGRLARSRVPDGQAFAARGAYAELGRTDILVNNAGMSPCLPKPRDQREPVQFRDQPEFQGALSLGEPDRSPHGARERGVIVNVSSIGALLRVDGGQQ